MLFQVQSEAIFPAGAPELHANVKTKANKSTNNVFLCIFSSYPAAVMFTEQGSLQNLRYFFCQYTMYCVSNKQWPIICSKYIKWVTTSSVCPRSSDTFYTVCPRSSDTFYTVSPRSSDPFYIIRFNIKWVTTSWTHSMMLCTIITQMSYQGFLTHGFNRTTR